MYIRVFKIDFNKIHFCSVVWGLYIFAVMVVVVIVVECSVKSSGIKCMASSVSVFCSNLCSIDLYEINLFECTFCDRVVYQLGLFYSMFEFNFIYLYYHCAFADAPFLLTYYLCVQQFGYLYKYAWSGSDSPPLSPRSRLLRLLGNLNVPLSSL